MRTLCKYLLTILIAALSGNLHATTYYWVRSTAGSWTSANSWSLTSAGAPLAATYPGSADVAVFNNGGAGTCTIAANTTVLSCSLATTFTGIVQVNFGITLTLSTALRVDGGTFTQGAGIINDNGTFDLTGGTYTGGSGYFTAVGSFSKTGGAMLAPTTMDLSGNFYISSLGGSFSNNSGTVILRGATVWYFVGVFIYDLILQPTTDMTITVQSNTDVTHSITFNGTGFIRINTGNIYLWGGNLNLNNTNTGGGGTGSITFIGGGPHVFTSTVPAGQCRLPNIKFQKSGGSLTIVNTVSVEGSITNIWATCATNYTSGSTIAMCGAAPVITMRNATYNQDIPLCNLTIMSGSAVTLGERLFTNSLRLESGGSLDVSTNNFTLDVNGNWTNLNSTVTSFNERQGTVRMYSGTIYAAIAGGESFYILRLDNPAGQSSITLNSRITILYRLQDVFYTNYNIIYGNSSNWVLFADNADTWTPDPAMMTLAITGPVVKVGNDAFTFPVGNLVSGVVRPRPITMSAPAATNESFVAQYYPTNSNSLYSHSLRDPSLLTMSQCEYWAFGRLAGTSSVFVTLSWWNAATPACTVTTPADMRVARWNGSGWINEGNSAFTGTASNGTVTTVLPMAVVSAYTLGSSTTVNPLPIELISFNAEQFNTSVHLTWSTATETNNDYFTIERSQDGVTVESIDTTDGAGTSTHELDYSVDDNHPFDGVSYYRLKQVDFNGQHSYSEWKMVELPMSASVNVWPNPSNGTINLQLPGDETIEWTMTVTDIAGNMVTEKTGLQPEFNVVTLNLPAGTYVLTLRSASNVYYRKICVTE